MIDPNLQTQCWQPICTVVLWALGAWWMSLKRLCVIDLLSTILSSVWNIYSTFTTWIDNK